MLLSPPPNQTKFLFCLVGILIPSCLCYTNISLYIDAQNVHSFNYINKSAENLDCNNQFDIITSVHLNHFFKDQSVLLKRLYNALKPDGTLLSVQNTAPASERVLEIALNRWMRFLMKNGRTYEEARKHIGRYGTDYFPLTLNRQKEVLCEAGFKEAELFWHSYIQTGIYVVKSDR